MTSVEHSNHYTGEKGHAYFAYQNEGGMQRGCINARKFSPYVRATDVVLDFGCANGSLLLNLECRRRIGVEVNPTARSVATAAGVEAYESVAEVADGSIDVIVSNHVLEHVLCPLQALRDLRRTLKAGGRLVVCLPIDDWRTQRELDVDNPDHHLYTWTPLLMGNLLAEAGYRVDRVWVYTHAWPPSRWRQLDRRLPVWLFDLICAFTAWRFKRRQIMALGGVP